MKLNSDTRAAAASLLARAFCDNPGMLAVLDQHTPEQRLVALGRAMVGFVRAAERYCEIELVEEQGAPCALALMMPPGAYPQPIGFELTLAPHVLRAGLRCALRFGRLDAYMRKHHERSPHWYLWFLAVLPEQQGRGHGSRLLRSLNARAEATRTPCYLETDKLSSVRLYERHGYTVQRERRNPAGLTFTMWHMLRPVS